MADSHQLPPLKPLHPDSSLNAVKLKKMESFSTEVLPASLLTTEAGCLKTRADGTILDGHHRILVLRGRGVDVDRIPQEIVVKETE
jgi:hypothetical protein